MSETRKPDPRSDARAHFQYVEGRIWLVPADGVYDGTFWGQGFYFADEGWSLCGPYATQEECSMAFDRYAESL